MKLLKAQSTLVLLRNCGAVSKATYIARLLGRGEWSESFDAGVEEVLEIVVGATLTERAALLAWIPVSQGGLGVRDVSSICDAAHAASFYQSLQPATDLLVDADIPVNEHNLKESLARLPGVCPDGSWGHVFMPSQSFLMAGSVAAKLERVWQSSTTRELALLRSSRGLWASNWLHACPIREHGWRVSDRLFRSAVQY